MITSLRTKSRHAASAANSQVVRIAALQVSQTVRERSRSAFGKLHCRGGVRVQCPVRALSVVLHKPRRLACHYHMFVDIMDMT
ncbi:MAG: hypothetical protein ACJASZ_002745 [Yoonia sp.]|jgi:hypothetical protein